MAAGDAGKIAHPFSIAAARKRIAGRIPAVKRAGNAHALGLRFDQFQMSCGRDGLGRGRLWNLDLGCRGRGRGRLGRFKLDGSSAGAELGCRFSSFRRGFGSARSCIRFQFSCSFDHRSSYGTSIRLVPFKFHLTPEQQWACRCGVFSRTAFCEPNRGNNSARIRFLAENNVSFFAGWQKKSIVFLSFFEEFEAVRLLEPEVECAARAPGFLTYRRQTV